MGWVIRSTYKPDFDIAILDRLLVAIQEHQLANVTSHSKARQLELVEYARQAVLDVKSGKLKPRSVAEIMNQLDDPIDEESA
jgi:putative ribosome biogenesis GTPase RsgA